MPVGKHKLHVKHDIQPPSSAGKTQSQPMLLVNPACEKHDLSITVICATNVDFYIDLKAKQLKYFLCWSVGK